MQTLLAITPILVLLLCLLAFKLSASKSGAIAMIVAAAIGLLFFGVDGFGLTIAMGKGMSLAIYVLLIVWAAVFLYHLVDELGAIDVITKNIVLFIGDEFVQFLLLAWLFSSILQGIAGFGVPVVIMVPILVMLGFDPLKSAAGMLLGHSWAVSFGSMGSSFFTIGLVSGLPMGDLGFNMAIFDVAALLLTGLSVCMIYGGPKYLVKGLFYVLPTTFVMSLVMFGMIRLEMFSVVGLVTALTGLVTLFTIYKLTSKSPMPKKLYRTKLNLGQALAPYGAILGLSLIFQLTPFNPAISFKFPGFQTALGYMVKAEPAYSKIKLLGHPAPIILMSFIIGFFVYKSAGVWSGEKFKTIINRTIKKCIPTTVSLVFLIAMALIMTDSGMTSQFGQGVATITGSFYPLFAPFFGVLGSFITGSNTNSNVIFGAFQQSVAQNLGVNEAVMCALQSISGSIGVTIGPSTILMAASSAKLTGQESMIYRRVMVFTLPIALILGIINFILLNFIK